MRYFSVTKFLGEAVADEPLDLPANNFNQDFKLIRVIDYLCAGIDSIFSDESTQTGGKALSKTREGDRGALSAHKDYCLSLVNMIVTQKGKDSFTSLKYEDVLVPRIPAEFRGSTEDVESEWNFIESCTDYINQISGSAKIMVNTKDTDTSFGTSNTAVFGTESAKKIDNSTFFYKASLLYAYVLDQNKVAYSSKTGNGVLDIKPGYINLDVAQKYIDPKIEANRKSANEFLSKILSYDENSIVVSDTPDGQPRNDIKDLLASFKGEVSADGNVFMSPNQLKEYIPLFEYIRVGGEQHNDFFSKIAEGTKYLEDEKGVHFGTDLQGAKEIQKFLTGGNYELTFGYSQAGEKAHTGQFQNAGEEIFVGYVKGNQGEYENNVIPVYIATTNKSQISNLKSKLDTPIKIGKLNKDLINSFYSLNTEGMIKRTGGNELIFQLPENITSATITKSADVTPEPETAIPESAPETKTVPENTKKAPVAEKKKPSKKEPPKAEVAPEPVAEKPVEKKEKAPAKKAPAPVKPKAKEAAPAKAEDPNAIERGLQHDALFGGAMGKTRLAKSALPRIAELAKLGHTYTPSEIDNLVERGLDRASVNKAVGNTSLMEVRISPTSYSLKALMENLNINRRK